MPLPPGTRLGHYEILALAGAGAMGEVYRARDPRLGREVALKILPAAFASDPERVRRFEQEVRVTGQLNHPNLLLVHDVGMDHGTPYLVSEILEGETLRDRLKGGALPASKAIPLAIQILHGLAAAHGRGIVHRDLKPENLFVLREGRVKILDFGIAKLTQPEPAAMATSVPTMTASAEAGTDPNVVIGTLGYMSPEQVRGLPVDHRSDLFSFGAVLYEMLTGRRAFQGKTPADTVTAILREEPPEMSAGSELTPAALERIVRHCLEKEPEARFQSASDVAFALETLAAAPRPAKAREASTRTSAIRWLVPLIACAALLAAGFWMGRYGTRPAGSEDRSSQKITYQRGFVTAAEFGSDDHTVFYSAQWDGSDSEIFSSDTRNPGSQQSILKSARLLAVSPATNELAVLVDYTGTAHNFAVGTLARMPSSGGSPRKILEDVMQADWSPDGQELAVVRLVQGRWHVEYPIGHKLHESTGWITHVRISPDGNRIAFLDHPIFPDDRGSVMVVDRTGNKRVLTDGWGSTQGLAWSADGDEVWFTGTRSGINRSLQAVDERGRLRDLGTQASNDILMDVSRTGSALVSSTRLWSGIRSGVRGDPTERELTWLDWSVPQDVSPEHRTVLFSEQGIGGGDHYSVCIRGTDGSPPIRLGEGSEGSLSPDGAWVLVVQSWKTPPQLVLLPTGAGEPRTLPETGLENIAGTCYFSDGTRILIVGNERGHGLRAFVRSLDGGPLRPVTPEGVGAITISSSAISPDGRLVAGITRGRGFRLYSVDGGTTRELPGVLPSEVPAGWARDSKALFVSSRAGARFPWKVYRVDLETGARSLFLQSPGPPDQAGVSIGVGFIASDERTFVSSYSRRLDDLYVIHGLGSK